MLCTLDLEEAATEAAGNWQQFKCFVWFRDREITDAEQWAIIYTHNRDSGLLDQSNSAFISKAMDPFTEAFKAYHELAERMDEYPILDESDYSNREYEATLDNIKDAAWRLKNEFILPEGWECDVYSWLSDNESSQIEKHDDQGGYPKEAALRAAFKALGFKEQE